MKPQSTGLPEDPPKDPLHQNDPIWDVLGQASKQEASPFFARNTVRNIRQLTEETPHWSQRLTSFFTPTRTIASLAAAACLILLLITQLDHSQPTQPQNQGNNIVTQAPPEDDSSIALTELIFEESLAAAAEDPSQFTHDELVTIVGL